MKVLLIEYNSPDTILPLYSPIRLQQKKKIIKLKNLGEKTWLVIVDPE